MASHALAACFFSISFYKIYCACFLALFFASLRKVSIHTDMHQADPCDNSVKNSRTESSTWASTTCSFTNLCGCLCFSVSSLSASCSAQTQNHSVSSLMMIIMMEGNCWIEASGCDGCGCCCFKHHLFRLQACCISMPPISDSFLSNITLYIFLEKIHPFHKHEQPKWETWFPLIARLLAMFSMKHVLLLLFVAV